MSRVVDIHYLKAVGYRAAPLGAQVLRYGLIKDGTLPHIRIGKAVRVPAAAFEAFVRAREDKAATAGKEVGAGADSPEAELEFRRAAFEGTVGMDPVRVRRGVEARRGEETPENAERAIDALALRALLQRVGDTAPA